MFMVSFNFGIEGERYTDTLKMADRIAEEWLTANPKGSVDICEFNRWVDDKDVSKRIEWTPDHPRWECQLDWHGRITYSKEVGSRLIEFASDTRIR